MKKITTKVLTIVAACAAMVFASCAQPSTSGSGAGAGGNGRPAAGTVVCNKAINISLPVNDWDGNDNGLQYHATDAAMFPTGVKAGEIYTVSIKGTLSADISKKFCFGFSKDYNWDLADLAVFDPADSNAFTTARAAAGESFDITFKTDAAASEIYLWVYTEGAGEAAKTLNLSEFKITKKN